MRKILVGALVASFALTMVSVEAQAKRLGGGNNVGKQQSSITNKDAASPQAPAAQPTPPRQAAAPAAAAAGQAAAQSSKSKWLGPLAGLAAGLGIAALLSHFGMIGPVAEFMANMLMFGLLIVAGLFIWRMIKSRKGGASTSATPAMAGAGAAGGNFGGFQRQAEPAPAPVREPLISQRSSDTPAQSAGFSGASGQSAAPAVTDAPFASLDGSGVPTSSAGFGASTTAAGFGIPAGFEVEPFLRSAKVYFVRLQAAWDAGDANDIREFTTPEMFAEIKMQLAERATGTVNVTDVVKVDAELLGVDTTGVHDLASVRFHGLIRETVNGPAEPFDEVWNIAKFPNGGWVLAGIQQLGQSNDQSSGTLH